MMKPGEQKPHCTAAYLIHAICRGCRWSAVPIPSTVSMALYSSTLVIFFTQERTGSPFTSTVHAPHCPLPQPILTLVNPSLLSTSDRVSVVSKRIIL